MIQKSLQIKNESSGVLKELLKEYIPQIDEKEKQKECDFFLEKILEIRKKLDGNFILGNYKPQNQNDQSLQNKDTEGLKDLNNNRIEEGNEMEASDSEDYENVFKEFIK